MFFGLGEDVVVLEEYARYSQSLVRAHEMPEDRADHDGERYYYKEVLDPCACDEEHGEEDRHHEHYGSEVRLEQDQDYCQQGEGERSDKTAEFAIIAAKTQIPGQCEYVCDLAEFGWLDLYVDAREDAYPSSCAVYQGYEWDIDEFV